METTTENFEISFLLTLSLSWSYVLNIITGISWAIIGFSSSYLLVFGGISLVVISLFSLLFLYFERGRWSVFWFGVYKIPGSAELRLTSLIMIDN